MCRYREKNIKEKSEGHSISFEGGRGTIFSPSDQTEKITPSRKQCTLFYGFSVSSALRRNEPSAFETGISGRRTKRRNKRNGKPAPSIGAEKRSHCLKPPRISPAIELASFSRPRRDALICKVPLWLVFFLVDKIFKKS